MRKTLSLLLALALCLGLCAFPASAAGGLRSDTLTDGNVTVTIENFDKKETGTYWVASGSDDDVYIHCQQKKLTIYWYHVEDRTFKTCNLKLSVQEMAGTAIDELEIYECDDVIFALFGSRGLTPSSGPYESDKRRMMYSALFQYGDLTFAVCNSGKMNGPATAEKLPNGPERFFMTRAEAASYFTQDRTSLGTARVKLCDSPERYADVLVVPAGTTLTAKTENSMLWPYNIGKSNVLSRNGAELILDLGLEGHTPGGWTSGSPEPPDRGVTYFDGSSYTFNIPGKVYAWMPDDLVFKPLLVMAAGPEGLNTPILTDDAVYATMDAAPAAPSDPAAPTIVSTGVDPDPSGTAFARTQKVRVDGDTREFQMYALKNASGETNYIKLRDLADALDGTAAQFNVEWNGNIDLRTKSPYTKPDGTENKSLFQGEQHYTICTSPISVDGAPVDLKAFTLTLPDGSGGSNYFKLRDLGQALGFNVGWSADKGLFIETDKPYNPAD